MLYCNQGYHILTTKKVRCEIFISGTIINIKNTFEKTELRATLCLQFKAFYRYTMMMAGRLSVYDDGRSLRFLGPRSKAPKPRIY